MALLVDSSVWIDYFNGVITPQTEYLEQSLGEIEILVGDLILAEVLQGFRSRQDFDLALVALLRFQVLEMVGAELAIRSAENYHTLRTNGITIHKTIDRLIATFCIETSLELLHSNRDFDPFEVQLGLKVLHP